MSVSVKEIHAPALRWVVNGHTARDHYTGENLGVAWVLYPPGYNVETEQLELSEMHESGDFVTRGGTLPEESVGYTELVSKRSHEYNPVYHAHIDGSVVVNYNELALSKQTAVVDTNNYWTKQRRCPIGLPGQEFNCHTAHESSRSWGDFWQKSFMTSIHLSNGTDAYLMFVISTSVGYSFGTGGVNSYPPYVNIKYHGISANMMKAVSEHKSGVTVLQTYRDSQSAGMFWPSRPHLWSGASQAQAAQWWRDESAWVEAHVKDIISYWNLSSASNWYQGYLDFGSKTSTAGSFLWVDNSYHADLSKLRNFALRNLEVYPSDPLLMNKLCAEALNSLPVSSNNGVSYLKEIPEMLPTVLGLEKAMASVPSKKVKAVAAAYLAVHYGIKLSISDTREFYNSLCQAQEYGLHRVQAAQTFKPDPPHECVSSVTGATARYQIFYDNSTLLSDNLKLFHELFDSRLTLENAWDMVPYSFVVDWFTKFSNLLQAIDNKYAMQTRYVTASAGQSIRVSMVLDPSYFGLPKSLSSLNATFYERIYRKHVLDPCPGDKPPTNPLHHFVEGAALIVSNKS